MAVLAAVGCAPSSHTGSAESTEPLLSFEQVRGLAGTMLERIRADAERIAGFGPRQTGQVGCQRTYEYVKSVFAQLDAGGNSLREFGSTVTVPLDRFAAGAAPATQPAGAASGAAEHTSLTVQIAGDQPQVWDASAFFPNGVQDCLTAPEDERPRRLVDLGMGEAGDFAGKSVADAVVLLNYNSGQAWLTAREMGAHAAIFIEPSWTNWRQSDFKYIDMIPIHMPRIWVERAKGLQLREALAGGQDVQITVRSRLRWRNVHAPCIEMTIPGKDPSRTYILASHFDARSIVPDLAWGGDEVWGVAALLELARYYSEHQPPVNLRFMAVSGLWQAQRTTRDYIAYDTDGFAEVGDPVRLIMGLDFSTERRSLNLIRETAWDDINQTNYQWIKRAMFNEDGWYKGIRDGLDLPGRGADLYAGERPFRVYTEDDHMAPRDRLCPLTYSPRFPTANEAWAAVNAPTFAFQTASLYRLRHNSPLDRFSLSNAEERFENLRPQLEMTLAVLDRLVKFPAGKIPPCEALLKHRAGWGEYVQLRGRMQTWDPSTGWFSTELPRMPAADAEARKTAAGLRTFVYAISMDAGFYNSGTSRERAYLGWPLGPHRKQHRELQSFMFREIRLLDEPTFQINALYTATRSAQVDVLGYALDEGGRILYATDFGVHGDGNPAFQCTDVPTDYWDLFVPVTLFPCGSVELYELLDIERRSFGDNVFGQNYMTWGAPGTHGDRGTQPFVRVMEVKNAESHTDMRSWSYVQFGPTAMIFLPARTAEIRGLSVSHRGEILLGTRFGKFTPLLNVDEHGEPQGYAVEHGQSIRINGPDQMAAAAYAEHLYRFDSKRLAEFAAQKVASPLANEHHEQTAALLQTAHEKLARGEVAAAAADYEWAWTSESKAYSQTIRLLLDVVSTTVFYFTLLIPFSFVFERLVFPQTNIVRTCLVAVAVFAVFVGLLYAFHPGFQLASNIVVTIVAFLIVVMTIPALILLLFRGVGMLKAMGSRAILLQHSEAEKAGVVSASLSLSVSNMRRRKLRTTLTLGTITTLVVALVLLTTSTSFEFALTEPQELAATSFHGIQVYNTSDRRHALLPETVDAIERQLADEALVLRREYVNYGFDGEAETGTLFVEANDLKVSVPYVQYFAPADAQVEYELAVRDEGTGRTTLHLPDLVRGADGEPVWFDEQDVNVCFLPNTTAERLGVQPGDTVEFLATELTVLGVWEARHVKRDGQGRVLLDEDGQPITSPGVFDRLMDLDAQALTPLKFSVVMSGEPDRPLHAPSSEIIILPRRFHQVHRILPVNTWSLIIIPRDMSRVAEMAGALSKQVMNVDVFYRFVDAAGRDRIEMISLLQSTKVKGSGMMFFMLIIAVLMILAIMMGTVHERMREISIFSSVGLAPRHVAGMFLIESLVYAGLASVLGYFIGIAALSLMGRADLLPENFYPNYLGVYVLYAIGVAMLATVASSLYPIRVAAQLVNPSLERSWRIDTEPENDAWRIDLPFIATSQREVAGMLAYAHDFLAVHQGERSGSFVCQRPPRAVDRDGVGGVEMDVWLAPFERNITQFVRLEATPMAARGAARGARWAFTLDIRRLSGPEYLWQRGNRAFVDSLRKHLLNWRAMSAQQVDQFVAQSEMMFAAPAGT